MTPTDEQLQRWTAKFWSKAEKSGDCWIWQDSLTEKGYGQFRIGNKKIRAHRMAYLLSGGTIPNGMMVCHKCDNPSCINPNHLFIGTAKDNVRDCIQKGRHCLTNFKKQYGERNGRSKLTRNDIEQIILLRRKGTLYRVIADKFNISITHASQICRGLFWTNH